MSNEASTSITKLFSNNKEFVLNLQQENLALKERGLLQATEMGAEIKTLMTQVEVLSKDLASLKSANEIEISTLQQVNEAKLKEAESESELLLLQLHQVQEELESVFLKEQSSAEALNEAQKNLELMAKDKSELAAKVEKLSADLKLAQEGAEALKNEKNQSLRSKEQEVEKFNAALEALTLEKNTIATERDQKSTLVQELQSKLDALGPQIEAQLKESQEENELLLLQLHQVQEELEHYFLEHQKLQRENEIYISRWQRLEDRQPHYLDFESIVPVQVDAVSEVPSIEWRATDITINGIILPEFRFITFLENGMPGISLLSDRDGGGPIKIIPRALVAPNAEKLLMQFRAMSSRHYKSLLTAVSLVEHFFKNPKTAAHGNPLPEYMDIAFWRQIATPLVKDMASLPAVFRFDEIKLKRELINTDYEHLWLVFHDATFGHHHWPKLEIRLGAANVQPGAFSRYPKLEIPRIDGKLAPFASWFEEAFDDFGGKLELRFDLNKQIFDVGVWLKLSAEDQAMMTSFIGTIPIALKKMEQDKVAISRPWDSWHGLATGLVSVLRRLMMESKKAQEEAKKVMKQNAEVFETANVSAQEITQTPAKVEAPSQAIKADTQESKSKANKRYPTSNRQAKKARAR